MHRYIIFSILMLICDIAVAQSDEACARYATYREASGEPVHGVRAVLDVLRTRARVERMSICKVVSRSGVFPWFNSSVDWRVPKWFLTKYKEADNMEAQVPDTVFYFNNTPFKKIGIFCCKIGNHYFYHKENLYAML